MNFASQRRHFKNLHCNNYLDFGRSDDVYFREPFHQWNPNSAYPHNFHCGHPYCPYWYSSGVIEVYYTKVRTKCFRYWINLRENETKHFESNFRTNRKYVSIRQLVLFTSNWWADQFMRFLMSVSLYTTTVWSYIPQKLAQGNIIKFSVGSWYMNIFRDRIDSQILGYGDANFDREIFKLIIPKK